MRDGQAGFTLIEALIAMAVLAAGAVTLLTATERQADLARSLQDRVVARWVASDRLTRLSIGLQDDALSVRQAGRDWSVEVARRPTDDAALDRVDIAVSGDRMGDPLYTLTGFVAAEGER